MKQASFATAAALALTLLGASALAATTTPTGAERKAILDALRVPVQTELKQPVEFVVDKIVTSGEWAFVIATPQRPGGGAIAWSKTNCAGDVSHLVGGLLLQENGSWTVRDFALCPTDVAWATWSEDHKAPAELFGLE